MRYEHDLHDLLHRIGDGDSLALEELDFAIRQPLMRYLINQFPPKLSKDVIEVAPQNEERHRVFLLRKKVVDTLVEEVKIDRNRELNVVIHLDLLKILDQDTGLENLSPAAYSKGPKLIPVYQIRTPPDRSACGCEAEVGDSDDNDRRTIGSTDC